MVSVIADNVQTKLGIQTLDYNIPRDHISRFVVDFVEENYESLGIDEEIKKRGRPSYSLLSMLKLLIYAKVDKITSADKIEELAMYHQIYTFVCDGITPSASKIREFKRKYRKYYNHLLELTLKKALSSGFTDFNHVACDGTPRKSHNNEHNRITLKEVDILLNYYNGGILDDDKLIQLRSPAFKLLQRKDISDKKKINLLLDLKIEFETTKQKKLPINDPTSRKMKGKKGNYVVGHNIQIAVDTQSSLICAAHVSSSPTDHYLLPDIGKKAIQNIGFTPKFMSADSIYLNETSLLFFVEYGIDGLIKNRKQSKEDIGRLNPNPYHKDHFEYILDLDAFLCPENQLLTFYKEYVDYNKLNKNPNAKIRLYNNYGACKDFPVRDKCLKGKQTHRTITENGSRLQREMYFKMELDEYKIEFSKRPRVEGPYGILRWHFNFENEIAIGLEYVEAEVTLDSIAYNLIRLYNLEHELKDNDDELTEIACEVVSDVQLTLYC